MAPLPEKQWKTMLAGETRGRVIAEERALHAEARADRAEQAAREYARLLKEIVAEAEKLKSALKSIGVTL